MSGWLLQGCCGGGAGPVRGSCTGCGEAGEGIQSGRSSGDLGVRNFGGFAHVRSHQFRSLDETCGGMSRIKVGDVSAMGEVYVDLQKAGRVVVDSGRRFYSLFEELSS